MKRIRRILTVLLAFAVILCSLGSASVFADSHVKPSDVRMVRTSRSLFAGDVIELNAKTYPSDSDDHYLRWSIVGNKGIVKIIGSRNYDDDIKIKGLKAGVTKICCYIKGTDKKAYVTVTVKKPTYRFTRVGRASRAVYAGDSFKLKVRKGGGLRESQLRWSIKDTSIVKFDSRDRYGSKVELEAEKAGTTTVTCTNLKTQKTITYTIRVHPDDVDYEDFDND